MRRYFQSGVGALERSLTLLAVAAAASGCAVLYPRWHECHEVSSAPLRFAVSIVSAQHTKRGYLTRSTASFSVYEEGGISLYHYSGGREQYHCFRLPQQELDAWTDTAETLVSQLEERRGELREVITVVGAGVRHEALGAIEDLDPDALEAARALACLALETFGERGDRAVRDAGPELTARLGFPDTCSSSRAKEPHP